MAPARFFAYAKQPSDIIWKLTLIDHKTIDDLTRRIGEALPDGIRNLQQDIEKNIRAVLTSTFARLDLVTREELEVQKEVLARTRARLEALEQKLATLESDVHKQSPRDESSPRS